MRRREDVSAQFLRVDFRALDVRQKHVPILPSSQDVVVPE
jgi:hypothetical protein